MMRGLLATLFVMFVVIPVAIMAGVAFLMAAAPGVIRVTGLVGIIYLFNLALRHVTRGRNHGHHH